MRLLPLMLLLAACDGKFGRTCSSDPVEGATATVDGEPWSASDVSWTLTGDSVHIVNSSEGAGWFSVVAQLTTDGEAVGPAVSADEFPIEVTLKTGVEGGFVTWYGADGSSAATTEGGEGSLVLSGNDEAGLTGCLSFTAGAGGADVGFEDGAFTAVAE